jgi:hypothetical protein
MFKFLKGWWYHLTIIKELPSSNNKKEWVFSHIDSLAVLVVTVSAIIYILLLMTIGPGEEYFIPSKKSYFQNKVGG